MRKPPVYRTFTSLSIFLASVALAAGTPAGTKITNVASLTFTPEQGSTTTIKTPPVTVPVAAICRLSILPNGTVQSPAMTQTIYPAETTVFKYTLVNVGNTKNTFGLTTPIESASTFTPSGISVHSDVNKNGRIDSNEPAINRVTLSADETAHLLIRVNTAKTSRGQAYVNLVGTCQTNTSNAPEERDANNVSRITLLEPPEFVVDKTLAGVGQVEPLSTSQSSEPLNTIPGKDVVVTITAINKGKGASQNVTLTDMLNTPDMKDFLFIKGTAKIGGNTAGAHLEYTNDGSRWSKTESSPVLGVRAVAPTMNPGEKLILRFHLRVPNKELGKRTNVAKLISKDVEVNDPADIIVKYRPKIFLGPINNPQAFSRGELSADDTQTEKLAIVNQEKCFEHTVLNRGSRTDVITTTGATLQGAASLQFRDMAGAPIAQPFKVTLRSGQSHDFQACYTTQVVGGDAQNPALKVLLTSKSSLGAADNKTIDIIRTVVKDQTKLLKSNNYGEGALVSAGDTITYTLSFTNNQKFSLSNVVVTDDLSNINILDSSGNVIKKRKVEFVSADNGGVERDGRVVWRFRRVAPNTTLKLKLVVRIPKDLGDVYARLSNTFNVTSNEFPNKLVSPPSTNNIYDKANVFFSKTSEPPVVRPGEAITYTFTVRNKSKATPLNLLKIRDDLPVGLTYVQGSSTLDGAPITPVVPTDNPRALVWTLASLAPGQSAEIRFRATVSPDAPRDTKNNAVISAVGSDRTTKILESSTTTRVEPLSFGPNNADIVGSVFLDRNQNGIYDHGMDVPYPGARVILSNGRTTLTDPWGRYNFRNVREGSWALRLDPNSVRNDYMRLPQDGGRPGSRLVYVRNLTSVDFPLLPDAGDIAIIRETTLRIKGGVKGAQKTLAIHKQVFSSEARHVYRVQLTLTADASLNALSIVDPLPEGAALLEGQNSITFDTLPSGKRVVSYRFRWKGDPNGAVTDPTASWRYE